MSDASDVAFIFDSDALIQILFAGPPNIFSLLYSDFSVRSYLMLEVEAEVRANKKFGALVRPSLEKALRAKSLQLLSSSDLDGLATEGTSPVSLADIRQIGSDYSLDVGKGEAYTHAAGLLLNTPVVSNDLNAIKILEVKGKLLPPTILRSFDIFGFLYLEKCISAADTDRILAQLKSRSEWMPKCLQHSSFTDGIENMSCRLSTSLAVSSGGITWSDPFYLKRG